MISSRDSMTPARCQAMAQGTKGGATSTTRPPARDSRASTGHSSRSSDSPGAGDSTSDSEAAGHPPIGNTASSALMPVAMPAASGSGAACHCQTCRPASRLASVTGEAREGSGGAAMV